MITTLEIIDIVWLKLHNTASLVTDPTKLTGGQYKLKRPAGSDKEDQVINSLGISNEQLQRGVINVNTFVPNLIVSVNDVQDVSQPDYVRIKQLSALTIATLKDVWVSDYSFDVQQEIVIEDEESGEYYSNIRLEFFNINL